MNARAEGTGAESRPESPAVAGVVPLRRLVVMRHAKSAWPEGTPDHERPLAPRGLRDAPAAGRALARAGWIPDLAVCSTAERARRTWELASAEWQAATPVRHEPRLYAADAADLLEVAQETPPEVGTLLLVGHNPGLEELILTLAAEGVDDTLTAVRTKFPTSAIAILDWHGLTWQTLSPHTALLSAFTIPRGRDRA
ncbi:SixA phosphatase family protein [Streptomyces sp. NPDC002566]|uniref:SixA phosphatase family protein n=1 Tax=Streptomyces sp. NPDC002566 TaxID=3364650 RepID=UPI0036C3B45B